MPDLTFWIYLGVLSLIYPIFWVGRYLWEKHYLTPQQRWQRKYDRKMKDFFNGI